MPPVLHEIVIGNVSAFLLVFMRMGLALMIMPGIGDSFVPPQVRLLFALAISLVLAPFLAGSLPPLPEGSFPVVTLLVSEAFIGIFIGTVMRIMITALDTAGMIISIQSGFSNALVFNPVTSSQGSVTGALLSSLGVTLLFITNMHHYMLAATVESYQLFPAGNLPDISSLSEIISRTVSAAFQIGVQLALPFLIVGTLVQTGFGLLGRLMPQIQIFFLAIPMQILLSLVMLSMTLSAILLFWLGSYQNVVASAISP